MNKYIGSGRITKVRFNETEKNGKTLHICNITVPVNQFMGDGKESETIWVELTAFSGPDDKYPQAQKWYDRYHEGDFVIVSGQPTIRTYDKKDGGVGVSMSLLKPEIEMGGKSKDAEAQPTTGMPF